MFVRGDEWSLRAFASMPSTAIFLRARAKKKGSLRACEQLQKFGEHEQASTRLNFASKSRKGKILRAVKNFNGPFITPFVLLGLSFDKLYQTIILFCSFMTSQNLSSDLIMVFPMIRFSTSFNICCQKKSPVSDVEAGRFPNSTLHTHYTLEQQMLIRVLFKLCACYTYMGTT